MRARDRSTIEEHAEDGEPAVFPGNYATLIPVLVRILPKLAERIPRDRAMVLLTIWLREVNSPESKQVQTPHDQNEE